MEENNSQQHDVYMRRCIQLARLGESFTAPNPMVGAVLVHNNRIIGEGYHQEYGKAHAEVNCLKSVKESEKNLIAASTLYVSLEPCVHVGKTPPCTDLILQHKIPRVVISVADPFDLVNGKGIEKLKAHHIDVTTGILEEEGKELLKHFLYFQKNKKPYITLKFAQSKDGIIGINGKDIRISNELSRRYTHQLRAKHQSILAGKNTVLTDNPHLTVRNWNGKNPIRIILGDQNSIPSHYNIFNDEAETIYIDDSILDVIKTIAGKNIISLLVEGGASTLKQFIDSGFWNELHVITSGIYLRNGISSPAFKGILKETIQLEDNTVRIFERIPE